MIVLAVDLGTTALKAVLADEVGRTIATAASGYDTTGDREGFAEQEPAAWWEALCTACGELKQQATAEFAAIDVISLCGQMHTHVYLGSDGRPLRGAISWLDQRSSRITASLSETQETADLIRQESANAVTTTYTAPNILWIQQNEEETWRKTRHILVAKDYLKYLLTGNMVSDYSEAAGTLLFNVPEARWSEPLLRLFKTPREYLPELGSAATVIGSVRREAAAATGIAEGTPVVNGATDNSTAALGAGVTQAGEATLIIGTAGVVSVCSDRPIPDPSGAVVCWNYALENRWINLGVMQTAGESLNWFRRAFDKDEIGSGEDIFSRYDELVETVPDGSGGLLFLPYLNGERTPYWDADARGVFFGAGLGTEKAHFIKAVMEGVAMALRSNADTVEALGQQIGVVRAVGGGLRSKPWLSILSRVLEKPIHLITSVEPSARGNVALGRAGLGDVSGPEEVVKDSGGVEKLIDPPGEHSYDQRYQLFLDLYKHLKPMFRKRAALYSA
ncbi:MAG: xylulokinase [Spirochaetaceae bacterium]|nr:MAG: xylulokinase [Spirochaetaceae bacterium]